MTSSAPLSRGPSERKRLQAEGGVLRGHGLNGHEVASACHMLTYKEFKAWIEIEGAEAKEYSIQQSRDAKGVDIVTCWIASEEGKVHFS